MKVNDITRTVIFRVDNAWWQPLESWLKTAEVRVLDEKELWAVCEVDPQYIRLEHETSKEALVYRLTWWGVVATGLGRNLVMFCWREQ